MANNDAIVNENVETTSVKLKVPEYVPADASQRTNDNVDSEANEHEHHREAGISTKIDSNNESISFDFFINVSIAIVQEDKIKAAICKSVDVETKQIQDLKMVDAGSQNKDSVRITGTVSTDDWEIRTLADKFTRLVPERILSGNLKDALGLEERPRVSRFYSRSSTAHLPAITNISPFPLNKSDSDPNKGYGNNPNPNTANSGADEPGKVKATSSLRTAKQADSASGLHSGDDLRKQPSDTPDEGPKNENACCIIL